jgi:intracellular multiplication protein IcmL
MAEETVQVVALQDDFYRDHFAKVILLMASLSLAILLMAGLSIYLYLIKPPPVTFEVGEEWRVQPPVPLDQPYHTTADVLQLVSDVVPRAFRYDFNHYNDQLKAASRYFTSDGWQAFLSQLNHYVNYNTVITDRLFITLTPSGAPFILNQGLLSGQYGWWVQLPATLKSIGNNQNSVQQLTLQILVTRVPTLNNLSGMGIQNIIVQQNTVRTLV